MMIIAREKQGWIGWKRDKEKETDRDAGRPVADGQVEESHERWSGKTRSLSLHRLPLPHGTDPEARPSPTGASTRLFCLTPISATHSQFTISQAACSPVPFFKSIHATAGRTARGLILPLKAAVPPPMLCLLRHFPGCCRQLLQANQAVWLQARACLCLCLLVLSAWVRMCDKTACTSVENMCVSEGVSKSERLSGNIHVCTSMLAQRGGFCSLVAAAKSQQHVHTDSVYPRRLLFAHCICTHINLQTQHALLIQ